MHTQIKREMDHVVNNALRPGGGSIGQHTMYGASRNNRGNIGPSNTQAIPLTNLAEGQRGKKLAQNNYFMTYKAGMKEGMRQAAPVQLSPPPPPINRDLEHATAMPPP